MTSCLLVNSCTQINQNAPVYFSVHTVLCKSGWADHRWCNVIPCWVSNPGPAELEADILPIMRMEENGMLKKLHRRQSSQILCKVQCWLWVKNKIQKNYTGRINFYSSTRPLTMLKYTTQTLTLKGISQRLATLQMANWPEQCLGNK